MALSIAWGHAQTLSNNKLRRGLDDFRKQGAPDKPCGVGRADANPKLLLNDT